MGPSVGGSFAPALTAQKLSHYLALAQGLPERSPVRDAMLTLYRCVACWWELPESRRSGRLHGSGVGQIVDLEPEHQEALWELIPWSRRSRGNGNPDHHDELEAIGNVLESIDPITQKELRDAAFHLLWHVHELDLDREPITKDKL